MVVSAAVARVVASVEGLRGREENEQKEQREGDADADAESNGHGQSGNRGHSFRVYFCTFCIFWKV
jgi:hypothetical protein